MRFTLPPLPLRDEANALLRDFYQEGDIADLRGAMRLASEWFGVPMPKLRWRRVIDRGWTAGQTFSNNVMELVRPRWWAHQHVLPPTEDNYLETFWHEWAHLLSVVDEEAKADKFAKQMMHGAV